MSFYPRNANVATYAQTDGTANAREIVRKLYEVEPALQDADGIIDGAVLGTAASTITTINTSGTATGTDIVQPDVARNLVAVANDDTEDGTIVVTGKNVNDATMTESLVLNGTTSVVGSKAFAELTSIVLPIKAGTGTVDVGTGTKIGLPDKLAWDDQVSCVLFDGTTIGTPTLAVSATAVESNTLAIGTDGTFNGTKAIDIIYDDITGV